MPRRDMSFIEFYRHHYRADHSHAANVALHVTGPRPGLA